MKVDGSAPVARGGSRLAMDVVLGLLVFFLLVTLNLGPEELAGPFLIVVGVLAIVMVVLRHRLLTPVVLLTAILVGLFPQVGVLLAVIAYTVGVREMSMRHRAGLLAAMGLATALATPIGIWALDVVMVPSHISAVLIALVVFGALPALVGGLVRQRLSLAGAERESAESLARTHQLALSQARLRERSRIAVEMHDLLGHRLSLISLHAGGLELATTESDPEAHRAAKLIRATSRQALQELRGILGMLRNDELADAPDALTEESGTKADLTALVDGSRAAGVDAAIDWIGDDLVGADEGLRRAVHRVVREALTNVHKHAPGASVSVRVARTADLVTVEVTNGMPSTPVAAHCAGEESAGLAGLQERVRLLGGTLRAEPTSDGGFSVVARVPVDAQARPLVAGEQLAPLAPSAQALPAQPRRTTFFPRDAVVSVAVVVGLFVLAGLASAIMGLTYEAGVSDQEQAVLEIGMPLSDFLGRQGSNDPLAQLAAHGQEPAMPAGATCLYQPDNVIMTGDATGLVASPDDEVVVNRYCFVDDKLVEIRDFALTSAAK